MGKSYKLVMSCTLGRSVSACASLHDSTSNDISTIGTLSLQSLMVLKLNFFNVSTNLGATSYTA